MKSNESKTKGKLREMLGVSVARLRKMRERQLS